MIRAIITSLQAGSFFPSSFPLPRTSGPKGLIKMKKARTTPLAGGPGFSVAFITAGKYPLRNSATAEPFGFFWTG